MESVGSLSLLVLVGGGLVEFGFGAVLEVRCTSVEHGGVAAQGAGGEESVAGGQDEVAAWRDLDEAFAADG